MNLKTGYLLKSGEYRVERVLGQGGFGITYLAEQTGLMRKVAIKEFFMREYCEREHGTASITLGSSGSREMVDRFRQKFIKEARAIAAFGFDNKHIVRIIDVFEENNTAYYVMEYVGGASLSDKVKTGALPEAAAVRYIRQIATALDFVHGKRMMHLDVKPSNILLNENDEAVLIDFGLAKQYDTQGSQTSTTPVGISHGYAPLEQYKQGGVGTFSPATDIYSLGATLYKLVTGKTPPEAGDVMNEGQPELPVGISDAVRKAVETAMQPAVKKRPQSIGEFLSLLDKNVKAESGKVKVAGKREQSTSSLDALPSDSGLREAKAEPMVATNQSGKPDDGATEILHSVQDDKYREKNSSTNLGEVPQAEGYNPNRASVISNESEKSPENGEQKILRSAQDDKKRTDNTPKRPFNKRLFAIISVAAICIIAAFFGLKSCNDRKAAEAQRATAIAEQQRIDAERKAQERRDSIAAEQQRLEQERLAQEAAEQQRLERERKAKEEADRKAKEEAERKAKEEAERKRKEETDRKAKEEAERKAAAEAAEQKRKEEERKRQEAAQTSGTINGHDYVDLGLSVKWATCNIGASSPGDYGDYYAWGETATKSSYTEENSTTYLKQMSSIAGNPTYDVARKNWGSPWRLPTEAEFQELIDNCTWEWTTRNGHSGYKVTSKKNGNSIFLPAAGWRLSTSSCSQGSCGRYWSATPYESGADYACDLYFNDDGKRFTYWDGRGSGISVRPVCE